MSNEKAAVRLPFFVFSKYLNLNKNFMPKIFEYLGIIIFFYSNEHEPVHVHAQKGENESKAEFLLKDGVIDEIVITNIKGKQPLSGTDLKNLKHFFELYANEIVKKWIDYFVLHKTVEFEKISKKVK